MATAVPRFSGRALFVPRLGVLLAAILLLTLGVGVGSARAADPAPPSVIQVSPDSSPTYGGQLVYVYLSAPLGYYPDMKFLFGGQTATVVGIAGSNSVEVETPPHARGTVQVQVQDSGGTSPAVAGSSFVYFAIPTVTDVSPGSGPAAGGTVVTVTGTGFTGATSVYFGGIALYEGESYVHSGGTSALSFTVDSDTQLTAVAPPGTVTGYGFSLYVTTASGGSSEGGGDAGYEYVAPPTVTEVGPPFGPASGGTVVTVNGVGFNNASAVDFGSAPAPSYAVESDTLLYVTAPPGFGTVDVTVIGPGGPSLVSAADQFRYDSLPTVTGVSPSAGPLSGETSVRVTGSGFTDATAVTFGGTAALGFAVASDTQLTATAPAGAGTVDISVTGPDGTSDTVVADQFTYVASPTVTGVSPGSGPLAGGTSVTITGTGFTGATTVDFGTTAASSFTVVSGAEVTAIAPGGSSGAVDVTVTSPGGASTHSIVDKFTYLVPAPTITSLSPTDGKVAGGTIVTITGTGFTGATGVTFGGVSATSFTVTNALSITATTPVGTTGPVDVVVTGPGGPSAAATFTFESADPGRSARVLGETGGSSPLPGALAALLLLAVGCSIIGARRMRRIRWR